MTTTLNASTASGLVVTPDNSGQIAFQNNGTTELTVNAFGIGLGTAVPSSGTGITFPAVQDPSSNANTLDDYEEGTWTPVITAGSGSLTSYTSVGGYTKIGNLVSLWGYFNIVTAGTAGGEGQVTLPFTPATSTSYRNGCGSGREDNLVGFMIQFYNQAGSTRADLVTTAGNALTWSNGYGYLFSMQYPV